MKAAEVKILVNQSLTQTEAFIWNHVRLAMLLEPAGKTKDCAVFKVKGKEDAKCCKLQISTFKQVGFCTYLRCLNTEPHVENAIARIPKHPRKVFTSSTVMVCSCKRSGPPGGICYDMPYKSSDYCKPRKCRPPFVCVAHRTGLKCIRKKLASKIVSTGPLKCKKVPTRAYQWVPYATFA